MNHYHNKTKPQLIEEIESLKNRIEELEQSGFKFKQKEKEPRESDEKLSKAQEVAKIGSWEMDITTEEAVWSDETYRLFGLEPQEFKMTFERFKNFLYPEDRETVLSEVGEAMANKDSYERDYRIVRRDNQVRFIHSIAEIEHDESGKPVLIRGTLQDITERKHAEEVLRGNEEKLRNIVEYSTNLFYSHTPDHVLTYISPQTREYFDCEPEEAFIRWTEFVTDNPINDKGIKLTKEAIKTGERQPVYEFELVGKKGRIIWVEVSEAPIVENGKTVAIVGALTEITERKKAEEALKQSEARLRQVIDLVPHYIFAKDHNGRFILANSASAESMGTTPEEIIGKTELEIAPVKKEAQVFTKDDDEVISSGKPKFIPEGRFTDVEGKLHFLQTIKIPFTASGSQNPSVLGVSVDITERKQVEKTMRESEERYRTLTEAAQDAIFIIDREDNIAFVNSFGAGLFGQAPIDVIGKSRSSMFPPELAEQQNQSLQQVFKSGESLQSDNKTVFGKHVVWLSTRLVPLKNHAGEVHAVLGISRDITEHKKAEQELKDSEYLLRESQKVANLGSYVLDMPGNIWKSSPILDNVFGIDKEYNKDISSWLNIVHPEDRAMMQDYFSINVLTNHESFNKEYRIIRINDQQERWVHGLGVLEFNDDGNPIKLIGTIQDITDRKRSEVALQKSDESLKLAQEFGKVGSWDWDILNNKLTWSDQSFIQLGLKPDEIEPTSEVFEKFIHPDDRRLVSSAIEQTLKYDKPYSVEARMVKPDGKEWIMHTKGKVIRDENGNPIRFVGVQQDITERKKAEEAHRESEERFSRLSGAAFEGIVISDAGKIIDVNDQLAKMMGYKPEEIIGKPTMEFVASESRELVMNNIKSGTEGSYEHFALKNDGSIFPVEVQSKTLPYEGRSFRVTAIRDTTERKKAEEVIRKLSHSVEQSPAIVMITDISGNIEYVNPKFEEVTGYTAKEVIGKSPRILKSSETSPEEYEILWKTIKAGGAWHGEFHNRKKNGELYWESASISAIKDTRGQLTHFIAIKEDITRRKAMDKRLRESHNRLRSFAERLQMIREEERATIAREIHDDLGQSLTALKMDISWVKNNPEMDVEAKTAKFDMMLDLINSTIQTVKRIATELRPGILDDLGLVPAIEWQAAEFKNRFKIQCNVSINKTDVIIKDEISIAVFRIFQETLTNVARHSGATKVDIKLNFHVDNKLIMEIADNGVGIDEEQINSSKSLGLFGMRERVNILNGEMEITGEHGKGTKVKVLIPVSVEEVGNNK